MLNLHSSNVIEILDALIWLRSKRTKDHKKAFKCLLYLFNDSTHGRYCKGYVDDKEGYLDENDPQFKRTVKLILDTLR